MQIVDSHHHLWNVEKNGAHYPWYTENHGDRGWGDVSAIMRNYLPCDLLSDGGEGGFEIVKSVHVQANWDFSNPVAETQWLEQEAGLEGNGDLPTAIVGYADLSSPDLAGILDGHSSCRRFRGIRQVLNRHDDPKLNRAPEDFLVLEAWQAGLAQLAARDLSFDAQIYHHQAAALAGVVDANPQLRVVIDHALMPAERDEASLQGWREAVRLLSGLPNIWMKISGFGMVDNKWTDESIRPFVLHCIDCFGPARVMFGSNFPVDRLMADYGRIWSAFDQITREFSQDERKAMFCGTAEKFYRI